MKKQVLALLLSVNAAMAFAGTTLTGAVNADNVFSAYISTSDSTLGTLIGSGSSWPTTNTVSGELTDGVVNYLHVVVSNQGGPGGFLGDFSLSGTGFAFTNGTQSLLTGDAAWGQNLTGFGNTYSAAVNEGANGVGPWGLLSGYGMDSPEWIWNYHSNGGSDFNTVYFSAAIDPQSSNVPEPASLGLVGLTLLGLAAARKKRAG